MVILIVSQRISELYIAKSNRIWALTAGAQEFGAWHYPLFFLLHIGWLVGWVGESILRGGVLSQFWYLWLCLFIIAQGLRYWCMRSLGRLWNTRILVIPHRAAISKGPYRFLRHPNYLAVAIELISVPLIFGSVITAILATFFNAVLILGIRIPQENIALGLLKKESFK
ncbi:isoprenylcysteine carboxyl methyltransferase family protein [Pelosinus sp. sgz500959]|uniref:isoprenylcysteine carboxyl methyltransferase family protein n=1 Tax=Pelosinus sp. sgz500959 TaxID=3242472 RepID=UPI0036717896